MKDIDYEMEALIMALAPKGYIPPPKENQAFLEAPESIGGYAGKPMRARVVADENGDPTYKLVEG